MDTIYSFIKAIKEWVSVQAIGISDIIEIIIISAIVYQIIKWVQVTRAWTLFKGVLLLLIFALFAMIFRLDTISYILSRSLGVGIMAVVVIFQPELRRVLEQLGRRNFFTSFNIFGEVEEDGSSLNEKVLEEICDASFEMGSVKTGALIVIEGQVALGEYERSGIAVDGLVTSQLLINIFEHNTPLHDGAVIVRGNRIVSATCYLPLTESLEIGKELGTRHRAAVGISEVSDSVTVVVSEETGRISVARDGRLYRDLDPEGLKNLLHEKLLDPAGTGGRNVFTRWKGMLTNERSDKK